jgi:hypothetical protein
VIERRPVRLLDWWVHADIQNITSSDDETPKVRRRIPASVFTCSVKNDVHMTVAVDHLATILGIILQPDGNVSVQLSD